MTTLTLTLPLGFTHTYDSGAKVLIPVSKPGYRLGAELKRNAPAATYDPSEGVVHTTLTFASAVYRYLATNDGPDSPRLAVDPERSADAHEALYREAFAIAKAAAPTGFSVSNVTFTGTSSVTSDFEAQDPFVRVTWKGELLVTWESPTAP